ncbi:MAG: TolC family protein [Deltaproteobacteria bacterium]|nr:TolC family protein [Deltaproteobacteria bacterium]
MTRSIFGACLVSLCLAGVPARANPLTLQQAFELAKKHSPTIKLMKARTAAANATRRAAWAKLYPTATVVGSFTHNQHEATLDYGALIPAGLPCGTSTCNAGESCVNGTCVAQDAVVIQKRNQFGFDAQAKLPLFVGPAYQEIAATQRLVRAATLRHLHAERDYLLEVARLYYEILGQQEAVKAYQQKVQLDSRNEKAAHARHDVGQVLRSDILRAELVHTQSKQALFAARQLLAARRHELGLLLGQPGSVNVIAPKPPQAPAAPTAQLISAAIRDRGDLRADKIAVEAAVRQKRSALWSLAPQLDLSFLYSWREAAGFSGERGAYLLALNLSWQIFNASRYAELRLARAQLSQRRAEQQQRLLALQRQIVRLRAQLLTSEEALKTAEKAARLALTTADDMLARYEAGTAIQLNVLDASQRRLEADLELTRSRYARDLARLALTHAVGAFRP